MSTIPTWAVCRPNLDLDTGQAGNHGERHGNVRVHGAGEVLHRALRQEMCSLDSIHFSASALAFLRELAQGAGDASGGRICATPSEMYFRWVDLVSAGHWG